MTHESDGLRSTTMVPIALFMRMLILSLFIASRAEAFDQVKVATPAQGLIELPVVVAMRNGYFQSEGLEIQKIQIAPDVSVKAMVAGEVDFNLAWEASVRAALSGAPIKLVAGFVVRPLYALISRPEIRSGSDLAGKTLGIDTSSSMIDFLSQVAVRYLGADKQLSIVEIGRSGTRMAALKAGEIDATIMDITAAAKAEGEGFNRLVYVGDVIEMPVSGIFVTRSTLAKQPERVKRFIRATLRAVRFIKHERSQMVPIIQHYLKITPAEAARSYDLAYRALARDGLVSGRVLAFSAWRAAEALQLTNTPVLSQLADWTLLREVLAERRKIPAWLKLKPYDF